MEKFTYSCHVHERNRKNTDEKLKDLEDLTKDPEGFDLDLLRQQKEFFNEPYDSGVDPDVPLTELKLPPDYIGQREKDC